MTADRPGLSRRRFLLLVPVALTGTAAAAVHWRARLRRAADPAWDRLWPPAQRIHAHFPYLDLDRAGVEAFVREYDATTRLPRFGAWPDLVYMRFLLSTDFFQHGADQSRRIRYVSLYHPQASICNNPLARFDE